MKAEILSIGTELLVGSILNTNAKFLSERLAEHAVDVYYQTTVGDNINRIVEAFELASERSDLIITSGGLGPTADDVTIEALSQFSRKPLKLHQPTHRHVLELLKKHEYPMTSLISKQCYLPQDAHVIRNNYGTAPGVLMNAQRHGKTTWILVLPGPPRELVPMFSLQALPLLRRLIDFPKEHFLIRSVKITGLVEAQVAQRVPRLLNLKPPVTVGIYAKPDEVELKIMAKHSSKKIATRMVLRIENEIRRKFKKQVMGVDTETLSSIVGKLLRRNKKTLSVAESCTGGLFANRITKTPGSSDYFQGGVVCYANAIKISVLDVPGSLIKKEGAVSRAVTLKLAGNVRVAFGTDYGVAISGIAGPSGGTKQKPVGLVYIATSTANKISCFKLQFFGTRTEIQSRAANKALDLLRLELLKQ